MFACCNCSQDGREVWIDFNKKIGAPFSKTPLKTRIYKDYPSLKDIGSFIKKKGYGESTIYLAEVDPILGDIVCYRELLFGIIPEEGPIICRISMNQLNARKLM